MKSRLFKESFIVRFLKLIYGYAKNSYLFHFDFHVSVKTGESKEVKPLGVFESLCIVVGDTLTKVSRKTGESLEKSIIISGIFGFIKPMQTNFVESILLVFIGASTVLFIKTGHLIFVVTGLIALLMVIILIPLFNKTNKNSKLMKAIQTVLSGGDDR